MTATGDLATQTLTTEGLTGLLTFEGRAAKLAGVQAVYGPGTFLNQTVGQVETVIQRELGPVAARAEEVAKAAFAEARRRGLDPGRAERIGETARLEALGKKRDEYQSLFTRYGYLGLPSLANRNFVLGLVFGAGTTPKERFQWLFPDARHALVLIRPEAGLSDARLRALGAELSRLAASASTAGVRLDVAGVPLVVAAVAETFSSELLRLAPVVVLGMLLALWAGLRARRGRLALLVPAGLAVLATAAASRLLGLGLTPATVAALPVVLGLAVDYGVQLQVRAFAERAAGHSPASAGRRAVAVIAPTLLVAATAMAAGFLALTLSSVPLIDRLGQTLAVGTMLAVVIVLALAPWTGGIGDARGGVRMPEDLRLPRVPALLRGRGRLGFAAGCVIAVVGLVLAGGTRVQSDVAELAPRGLPELAAVERTQRELGVGGTLRIAITGADVTRPDVLAWQAALTRRALAADPRLRPGPNLGELLSAGGATPESPEQVRRLLAVVPSYFLDAVLSRDRRRSEMTFGVPVVDVHEQGRILARLQPALDDAPPGVRVEGAGLVASAVSSVEALEGDRGKLLLLASLAVALVLLVVHRRLDRALIPLVPALMAAGISACLVRALGIDLSPLGAGLEPLVLAVGVEFGVLLDARYREARTAGAGRDAAATAARRHV
ncbi:MAG: hypothetical protein JWO90_3107, partial [Solirubrobacterales bacterium]|nr:hypothetical protein [Solirubrobacterales bacterium]